MNQDQGDDGQDRVDEALGRFGLPARPADRAAIIAALEGEIRLGEECDEQLMRLLCAQLFSLGQAEDAIPIWIAKSHNFDTFCGIDVQLLCGGGLEQTKAFLAGTASEDACAALEYLGEAEASGDFNQFRVEQVLEENRQYYHSP